MVYVAPAKGARGGKSGAPKNGKKGNRGRGREEDALASKADLLAKLTREAEEHTRILERERAALGLPSRLVPNDRRQQHQQQKGPPAAAGNARNRRGNYHVYTDQGNKKVFDPRQIPGLGGPDAGGGGGGRVPGLVQLDVTEAEQTLNQTFPDSPNFYPGRVFAVPDTIPAPPNQSTQQQAGPDGGTIVVAPWHAPRFAQASGGGVSGLTMHGQPHWLRQAQPLSPSAHGPGPTGPQPPLGMGMMPLGGYGPGGPPFGPGGCGMLSPLRVGPPQVSAGGAGPEADPRVAARMDAEARKEAYRLELEEQIRAKKQAKEAEERRRREEDAAWEARAAAAPQPWDPEARAARRGGGGDPVRDEYGRPVANLRQRGGPPGSPMGMRPPGMPPPQPMGPTGAPFPGPSGPPARLTVEIPGGGAGAFPGAGVGGGGILPLPFHADGHGPLAPSSHGHGPLAPLPLGAMPGMPGGGGPFDGPPPGVLSPSSIPPVSPGNRRFMAAMNDLIAGPSDEQRRQKEMARQRLQMDLEEQIREKRERQARERAEVERQRLKEEAEMKALQDNLTGQRQADVQRARAGTPTGRPRSPHPQQQLQRRESSGGGMDGGRPPLPPRRHGKGGKIIDASWLDAPKAPPPGAAPPAVLPPLSSPPQAPQISPRPALYTRRASAGLADGDCARGLAGGRGQGQTDELAGGGQGAGLLSPVAAPLRRAPSHDGAVSAGGAGGGGRGHMTTLLQQLQEEQSRMREDFARQAVAMEKLASDASRALADRDEAWLELQRVKAALAGEHSAPAVVAAGEDDGLEASYGIGTVIVNTHILPKTTNSIPDPLPKPVSSEVLRRGRTDPGRVREGGGDGGGSPLSPVPRCGSGGGDGLRGGMYGGGFGYGDLGPLQDGPLNRAPNVYRRSGIPLPPGMIPARSAHPNQPQQPLRAAPPRIQSVYGYGFDTSPPKSRYNSFFGLEQGDAGPAGQGRGGGSGSGAAGLPSLGPRKPPSIKPPPSPAILRGDLLPSPVKQSRGPPQHQNSRTDGARARSDRALGGRGRAASAVPLQSHGKSPPELPPVAPPPGPTAAAAAVAVGAAGHPASRRSLEGMQKLLRRGHEERLLRGLGSDDGSGSTVTTAELVPEEPPVTARSDVVGRRRSSEASLPGDTAMMSPGAAAEYLGFRGGLLAPAAVASVGGAGGKRSFYSDSIASYKSLLTHRSAAAAPERASAAEADDAGGAAAPVGTRPPQPPSAGSIHDRLGTDGGSGSPGVEAEPPSASTHGSLPAAGARGARRSSGSGGGDDGLAVAAAGAPARTVSAVSAVSAADSQLSDMPMRRPVRAGRRVSTQRLATPPVAAGGGGPADATADPCRSPVASSSSAAAESIEE